MVSAASTTPSQAVAELTEPDSKVLDILVCPFSKVRMRNVYNTLLHCCDVPRLCAIERPSFVFRARVFNVYSVDDAILYPSCGGVSAGATQSAGAAIMYLEEHAV